MGSGHGGICEGKKVSKSEIHHYNILFQKNFGLFLIKLSGLFLCPQVTEKSFSDSHCKTRFNNQG